MNAPRFSLLEKRGGMRACVSRNLNSGSGQPPSFSRCGCTRVIRPMRSRKKVRGRAGRRGVRRTHGPRCVAAPKRNGDLGRDRRSKCRNRKSAFSPASRARCLRLSSAWPPVAEVSVHRCGLLQRLAVRHGVTALPPKNPVTPSVAPGPCSFSRRALGVRVAPVRGHREPVPLNDASRSALGWTGLGAV